MHDFQLHIADLVLSWAKHGPDLRGLALNLLLWYYKEESPLPADIERLRIIADCQTKAHEKGLDRLLKEHFILDESGPSKVWRHRRCDREIARFRHRCAINAYNNLAKFVKSSGGEWAMMPFEIFAASREHYQDEITGRWRNLPKGESHQRKESRPANHGTPTISDSENMGARGFPDSGGQLPNFPTSQPPNFPASQLPGSESPFARASSSPAVSPPEGIMEKKEEGPPDLLAYLRMADAYSRGNPDGLVIPPGFVRHWHDLRVSMGWETKGGTPIPATLEARFADLRKLARLARQSGELAGFTAAKVAKKAGAEQAEIQPCPVPDYKPFAVERLGWGDQSKLTWETLHAHSRKEWLRAWEGEQNRINTGEEAA